VLRPRGMAGVIGHAAGGWLETLPTRSGSPRITPDSLRELSVALSQCLKREEGRGHTCTVEYFSRRDSADGTSNTLMIGEDLPSSNLHCSWPYSHHATGTCAIPLNTGLPREQTAPIDTTPANWVNVYSYRSRHPGGAQSAFDDGSVQFVPQTIDLAIYRALATIDGGEVAQLP
jgi:hypothetical protein